MGTDVIAPNVRRIRSSKGLSQAKVAEQAGISVLAYHKIEAGKSIPRIDTLQAIAEALDSKIQDLVVPVRTLSAVRFRALKKMTSREQILVDVATWLNNYQFLEELLNAQEPYKFAKLARTDPDPIRMAEKARDILGLNTDKHQDVIRDICGLLESAGVKVLSIPFTNDSFFGLSVGDPSGGPAIVVNTNIRMPVERWIFSAAHELGHLLLHLDAYNVESKTEDADQEMQANLFASYFLMPDALFESEWKAAYGLPFMERVNKVKRIFKVSYGTVLHRLVEKGKTASDIWMKYRMQHRRLTGQPLNGKEEPLPISSDEFSEASRAYEAAHLLPADFVPDRLYCLVRQALKKEKITLSRAAEILRIDLSEMRENVTSWDLDE